MVTDYGEGDRTNFIMILRAFMSLGINQTASEQVKKIGIVDIECQRVPCKHPGLNIVVKVQESNSNPGYFAIVLLNVGGKCDVTAIELWQAYIYIDFFSFYIKNRDTLKELKIFFLG